MATERMAQQARRKKKSLKQIQDEMFDKNFEARFDKAVRKTKEDISKVDKGFMKDPKNRDKIIMDTFVKADRVPVKEMTVSPPVAPSLILSRVISPKLVMLPSLKLAPAAITVLLALILPDAVI